jgi:hypothetical protein
MSQPYNSLDTNSEKEYLSQWWIPINYATESDPNFDSNSSFVWLEPNKNLHITIDPNDWIIINLQQMGNYTS